MSHPRNADLITEIMLSVFRVNGRLLACGDELVAALDLSSARWQILGAIAIADTPLTAPQVADAMGISRQGAQKQLHRMSADGLIRAQTNPRHERSPLYALTPAGGAAYEQAIALNTRWTHTLALDFDRAALETTLTTLRQLQSQLAPALPTREPSA